MELITKEQRELLLANWRESEASEGGIDHVPVVKIFTPDAGATWLLSELDERDLDTAFGLCDLGMGSPELGYVSLAEIESVRGALRLPPERDIHFKGTKPLTEYAKDARIAGAIQV